MKSIISKFFLAFVILIGLVSVSIGTVPPKAANAYSNNNMIDDSVFDNSGSMSTAQIQAFLNQFPNSCIKNYSAPDPLSWYNYGGLVSAAQVIKDSSALWGINPQVLLTTMEKEEGLVRGDGAYGCSPTSFWSSMGYHCPGTTTYTYTSAQVTAAPDNYSGGLPADLQGSIGPTCVGPTYPINQSTPQGTEVGFSAQVSHGAWQLEFGRQRSEGNGNLSWDGDNNITYYGYMTAGSRARYQGGTVSNYSGVVTLNDGNTVTLTNGATASLYSYTPYIQSFDTIFEGFFGAGSTSANAYQWSYAGQTSSANLNALPIGQKSTLTVSATNTGTVTWTNTGANKVDLGTDNPHDRASSFCRCTRVATMDQSSVAPGQTATFTFTIQAPASTGTYHEYFNLVAEGITWLNDPGQYFPITVVNPNYTGTITANTLPTTLTSGTTTSGTVSIRNDGNVSWYNDGFFPVRLGSGSNVNPEQTNPLKDSTWPTPTRPAAMTQSEVDPGQTATFTYTIDAPSTPGTYNVTFDPVAESYIWFGSPFSFSLIAQGTFQASALTNPTVNILAGQSQSVTVSFVNQGTATWSNTGATPVNLGTTNPQDRMSAFCDSSWIGCNRAATLNESSVVSGGTGTFTFILKTSGAQNGTYNEAFAPVEEGQQWFGSPVTITINVAPVTYTWNLVSQAAFTDSGKSTPVSLSTLSPGQTAWLQLKAKNTGTATWLNNGSNPIDLGTNTPQDHVSPFCTNAWLGCARPARLIESSVAPGATGTFEFPIQVPNMGGAYFEHYNLVAEGATWMNDIGLGYYFNVNNGYSWQLASQYAYTDSTKSTPVSLNTLSPGQTVFVGLTARNTGSATWYNTGKYPMDLGASHPQNRVSAFVSTGWVGTRPARLKEASVAPGQTGTFEFNYTAPSTTSTYQEYFTPVAENITWLNDIGLNFYTVVR